MEQSLFLWAIFHSYVSLPEGNYSHPHNAIQCCINIDAYAVFPKKRQRFQIPSQNNLKLGVNTRVEKVLVVCKHVP